MGICYCCCVTQTKPLSDKDCHVKIFKHSKKIIKFNRNCTSSKEKIQSSKMVRTVENDNDNGKTNALNTWPMLLNSNSHSNTNLP